MFSATVRRWLSSSRLVWPHSQSDRENFRRYMRQRCTGLALMGSVFVLSALISTPAQSVCTRPATELRTINEVQARIRNRIHRLASISQPAEWAYLAPHRFAFQIRHGSEADRTGTIFDDGWRQTGAEQTAGQQRYRIPCESRFHTGAPNPCRAI